ncbi:hypothetical protein [Streptomyces sp. NPDC003635]
MNQPSSPCPPSRPAPLRVTRAGVFTVAGTALGVSAHQLAADGAVPWRQAAAAAVVLFGVALAGARRPRSLGAVVGTCGVAQTALHLWLSAAHAHRAGPVAAGHTHHGAAAGRPWHEQVHVSPAMTAAHAVAALLVAVLLHRADAACWTLARGVTSAVDAVRVRIATAGALGSERTAPLTAVGPAPVLARTGPPPRKTAVLADVVVRRGPPRCGVAPTN